MSPDIHIEQHRTTQDIMEARRKKKVPDDDTATVPVDPKYDHDDMAGCSQGAARDRATPSPQARPVVTADDIEVNDLSIGKVMKNHKMYQCFHFLRNCTLTNVFQRFVPISPRYNLFYFFITEVICLKSVRV